MKSTQSRAHLTAQELIQVPQLFALGDLSVQGGVPLVDTRGPADADGGVVVVGPAAVLAGLVVRVRVEDGQWGGRF